MTLVINISNQEKGILSNKMRLFSFYSALKNFQNVFESTVHVYIIVKIFEKFHFLLFIYNFRFHN